MDMGVSTGMYTVQGYLVAAMREGDRKLQFIVRIWTPWTTNDQYVSSVLQELGG